jgi:hypothetical protein
MKRLNRSLMVAFLTTAICVPALLAQPAGQTAGVPAGQAGAEEDGPGRGVARISLMNGDVSVRRGDSGDAVAAAINGPLMAEDRVLTGPGARAEIQLNYYNRIRLAGDAEVRFPELEWHKYQIQVASGTIVFSALPGSNDQIEFATEAAALRPLAPGSYRITVLGGGTVEFTVRRGEADIFTPSGSRRLTPGHTMRVHLAEDNTPEFQLTAEIARDAFDEFNARRDQELSQVKSYQHMSRDIEGGEDLDNAGEWVDQAPYGSVWRPYVSPDWAPYQDGRWMWEDYYGWTWLSYDAWGWGPYHYGRWFNNAGSWYWYPGGFGARMWWRPALVGFFGWGGFGVGFGFGGYGWVPLGPFEMFHPWYGRGYFGGGRWGGFNQSMGRNGNIGNVYRNARVAGGVHGTSAQNFGRGSVGRGSTVPAGELSHASAMHGPLPVTPSRESLRMSDRASSSALSSRSAQSGNQRFVGSRQTSSASRTSFEQQRQSISQAVRGSTATAAGGAARTAGASGGAGNTARTNSSASTGVGGQGGWPRANAPSGTPGNRTSTAQSTGAGAGVSGRQTTSDARGGWGSFGAPGGARSATSTANSATRSAGGGWTSFGNPERSSGASGASNSGGYSTNANGNVNVFRGGQNSGGTAVRSSEGWSTGGSGNTRVYGSQSAGNAAPRSSGSWSTGGASSPRYSTPGSGAYGSSAPRYSAPSGGSYSGGGGHVSSSSSSSSSGHVSSGGGGGGGGGGGHVSSGGGGGGGGHSGHR